MLSVGKSALEDLGEFTALDDTFNVLEEEHEAEDEMEEDVPEEASVGSGAMSNGSSDNTRNGSRERRVEMEQDQLEDRSVPVPEGNVRMRSDEAGPSRPPPKRGRVYRGG